MDVALVGLVLPEVQNHSLGSLQRAARRAGMDAGVVSFRGWPDLERTVARVLRARPRMCGLSIQTTESSLASLALARVLRGRGYRGQIVCGGHFATLNAEEILRSPAGVDAVVRFAGEDALVGLLRGAEPSTLPGVVTLRDDGSLSIGAPARVVDEAWLRESVRDDDLPVHLGFPAADLVFSRGCEATCAYCCVAAASALARREGQRAGAPASEAVHHAKRTLAIADEIAWLFHEKGARVFHVMDDNLLPIEPEGARAFVGDLRGALEARRVGRFAFSLQLRADAATPEVVDALVDLGLVRAYVGIDGYSAPQLRALGRASAADAGPAALGRLADAGVFSVCNALLLGPTIRFESVLAEIEGLSRIRHAPVHLLPIDVRAGTKYAERAERRGLVEGGFLFRRFRFEDERTDILGSVIAGMPSRLAEHSVPIALYDLGYNLGIARRLVPGADVADAVRTYADVTRRWNADQIRLLRAAASAAANLDRAAADALRLREEPAVRALDDELRAECAGAIALVERAVSTARRERVRAHERGRLLSAIAFSMSLSACGTSSTHGDADADTDADTDVDADVDADADADADTDTDTDTTTGSDSDTATVSDTTTDGCPDGRTEEDAAPMSVPCGDPCTAFRITFDENGVAVDFAADGGGEIPPDVLACLEDFFAAYCYPSLAGRTESVGGHCWIA